LLLLLLADVGFGFGFGLRCCTFSLRAAGETNYIWFGMTASTIRDKYRGGVRDRANVEWHLLRMLQKMSDGGLRVAKVQKSRCSPSAC
jgi:hypothetical protein